MTNLCDYCSKIPFSELACPTASDIIKARDATKSGEPISKHLPENETKLGTLGRIREAKEHCDLCALFYNVIRRREAQTTGSTLLSGNGNNVTVVAWVVYANFVTESLRDGPLNICPDAYFNLMGLTLQMCRQGGTGVDGNLSAISNIGDVWDYCNIAQPCYLDEFIHTAHSPEMEADDRRMLFAGRKRPEVIEFDLLQSWIRICETSHQLTCRHGSHHPGPSYPHSFDS